VTIWLHQGGTPNFSDSIDAMALCGIATAPALSRTASHWSQARPVAFATASVPTPARRNASPEVLLSTPGAARLRAAGGFTTAFFTAPGFAGAFLATAFFVTGFFVAGFLETAFTADVRFVAIAPPLKKGDATLHFLHFP
jgi:hypothetical protein